MAISKIQLGNGTPQEVRDANALHYIGHVAADGGITVSQDTYTSGATVTINGSAVTVAKYDYVTFGDDNINLVCVSNNGVAPNVCTYEKLTEAAADIPVLGVTVNGTSVVDEDTKIAEIGIASASDLGVVKIGNNITIGDGQSGTTLGAISVPDATASVKGVVQLANAVDGESATAATDVPTVSAVATAIAELPQAMIFRGTLGTGGTVTDLPTAAASTAGDVYKVIVAGTYGGQAAEVGDLFICQQTGTGSSATYAWVLVPSGDVPAGTVTSVQAAAVANSGLVLGTGAAGASGDPITSSGTITVGVDSGYAIPETTDITNWNATYTKVNPYTDNNDLIDGLTTSVTQSSGDGSVLVAEMGTGNDDDTLIIKYIKPTISATATNVVKPITTP